MKRLNISVLLFVLCSPAAAGAVEYSLDDCIKMALDRSEMVKTAQADLEFYRGKYHEAFSAFWLPHVQATLMGGGPVGKMKTNVERVTDASNFAAMGVSADGVIIRGGIDIVWPLYTFGKLGALMDAASSGVDAATSGVEAARTTLAMNIRKAYYGYMMAQEVITIIDDGKTKLNDARKKVKEQLDAEDPQATEKDLFKIDYYASELVSRHEEASKGVVVAESTLRMLTGVPAGEAFAVQKINIEEGLADLPAVNGYIDEAAKTNPGLKALARAVDARTSLTRAASRAYYPDIFIGGGFNFSWSNLKYDEYSYLVRDDVNYVGAAVGLGIKIDLDIGIKYGQEEQARAELSKIRNQAALAEKGLSLQVRKAYAEYKAAQATYKSYKSGAKAARKWLVAATMNYNAGLGDTRDMLDALVAHAQARIQELKTALDAKMALAELLQATGGK